MNELQRQWLNTIAEFPERLQTAVSRLTPYQLDTPFIDGEWSVRQIVHHCADSHMNSFIRLKLILTEENPPLKPYAEPLWALTADVTAVPIEASLTLLRGLHERWVALFASLPDEAWTRTGFHSELNQAITPADLLEMYAAHCRAHLDQIQRTLAAEPRS